MADLPRTESLEVTLSQPHAMVNAQGEVFYPDDEEDARWFADEHGARPLDASDFPFRTQPGGEPMTDLQPTHDAIAEMAEAARIARFQLAATIMSACPGIHKPVQHRDRRLPWCEACGYTETGGRVKTPEGNR